MTEDFIQIVKEEYNFFKENINGYNQERILTDWLYDYLKNYMTNIEWPLDILNDDKYPIYCFHKSQKPIISTISGKRMCGFKDLYYNLQQYGYSFGPSDLKIYGKNREKFRKDNKYNIIYPPKGESFENLDTFYRIQTEFVLQAIKTNQKEAKKLLLQKYGKR